MLQWRNQLALYFLKTIENCAVAVVISYAVFFSTPAYLQASVSHEDRVGSPRTSPSARALQYSLYSHSAQVMVCIQAKFAKTWIIESDLHRPTSTSSASSEGAETSSSTNDPSVSMCNTPVFTQKLTACWTCVLSLCRNFLVSVSRV